MAASAQAMIAAAAGAGQHRRLAWSRIGLWLALGAVVAGLVVPLETYLTPQHGLGYALGITGGSLMLLMLVYPLRKRMPSLTWLGSVPFWFRLHMVLGILGPLAILYHSNFSLGATNSNVALACMLIVAGSGLVGRYLYARIHHGLYGRRANLRELAVDADNLRRHSGVLRVLPELMAEVERAEGHIAQPAPLAVRPILAALRQRREAPRLRRLVQHAIAMAATRSIALREQQDRFTATTCRYVEARLMAARRVAEFEACERLFAAWHVLHLPLFVMLMIVGVVHVIAVHVY
jgi:hypothetical protein